MVSVIIDWEGAVHVAFFQLRETDAYFIGGGAISQRRRAKLLLVASQCPCSCKNPRIVQRIFKMRTTEGFTEICRHVLFGLNRNGKGAGMPYTVW
jgi:hypothetical protein